MIRAVLVKLAYALRGRPLLLDEKISNGHLLRLMFAKSVAVLRGVIRTRSVVAIGKSVVLIGKGQLRLQRGVMIGDYSSLDATGIQGINVGQSSSIGRYCCLAVSGSLTALGTGISIGRNVGVGDFSFIGGAGGVTIGDDVIMGQWVSFHPENHNYENVDVPIRLQGVNRKGIVVGDDCWIGAKVTVLDGTHIHRGCVIAAGSLVRGEIPPFSIAAGVPARVIGARGER